MEADPQERFGDNRQVHNQPRSIDATTLALWVRHHRNATLTRTTLISIAFAQAVLLALPWWNFVHDETGRLPATVWLLARQEMSDERGYTDILHPALAAGPVITFVLALLTLGIAALSSRRGAAMVACVACVAAGVVALSTVAVVVHIANESNDVAAATAAGYTAVLLWSLAAVVAAVARFSGDEPQ
jgi:hypothetical protein